VLTEPDVTGEKAGLPYQSPDTAAQQEEWEEVHDSQVLNATVYSTTGEEIGKIQQVLKDTKSGETEYVVVVSKESKL
jgi:ribosomal 30S subunit maturation factor RimM